MAGRDSSPVAKRGAPDRPLWTIGAVSRETGLSPHTIRVWQRRYGFPAPSRKRSGHRLYSDADVRKLRQIVEAIRRGHRPGQIVALTESELTTILRSAPPTGDSAPLAFDPLGYLFGLVKEQRSDELTAALLQDASMLGPLNFVEQRAIPLIERVGEAWAAGVVGIRHEHSFSERLGDVLRTLRMPYERQASGPVVLLSTLPGELHALGMQMAALIVALAGGRPDVLGTDTPPAEIAASCRARGADAIAVSVSSVTAGPHAARDLGRLRRAVDASIPIFVGGRGAAASANRAGLTLVADLESLYVWVRRTSARQRRA